jgi:hypothetical protein
MGAPDGHSEHIVNRFNRSKFDELYQLVCDFEAKSQEYNIQKIDINYAKNTFDYTKIDFLNIKNPKIIDAHGHNWNNIHEKKYYDISDKLDKIKDRLSDDIYSSIDNEYDSESNFSDIIYKIVHLYNAT